MNRCEIVFPEIMLTSLPVALLGLLELDADDACEGGPDQGALEGNLAEAAGEEVNILHREVDLLQPLDHVLQITNLCKFSNEMKVGESILDISGSVTAFRWPEVARAAAHLTQMQNI